MRCRCGHGRDEHEHFHAGVYCSARNPDGEWCGCPRFRPPRLLDPLIGLLRQPVCRCETDADAVLRNVLLFGRFADPTRLPPWPPERAQQILQRLPRGPRFIAMPANCLFLRSRPRGGESE